MAKKIRNQKTIDWNTIKFQAFALGFKEFYNFICIAKVNRTNALVGIISFPKFTNTKNTSKLIRQQANTFGLKCSINKWQFGEKHDTENLTDRRIEIGAYY